MKDFENFYIEAWTDEDGLTIHVDDAVRWTRVKRPHTSAKTKLAGTFVAFVASSIFSLPVMVAATQTPVIGVKALVMAGQSAGRDVVIGSPYQFWSTLAAEVRSWKAIETETPDVPPFI